MVRRVVSSSAGRSLDGLLVGLPPVAMLAVFALPEPVRRSFAFRYGRPTLVSAYTAHFVHFDIGHLVGNLLAYLLLASLCFALVRAAGRRRQFRVVFLSLLLAFPFVLSGLNLAVPRPGISYGASGLVMGVFGYLPLALWTYGVARLGWPGLRYAPVLFFAGTALIASLLDIGRFGGIVVGASLAVVAAYLLGLHRALRSREWLPRAPTGSEALLVGLATTVFLGVPSVAFPETLIGEGTVLNVYIHFLGYALGFLVVFTGTCIGRTLRTRA